MELNNASIAASESDEPSLIACLGRNACLLD